MGTLGRCPGDDRCDVGRARSVWIGVEVELEQRLGLIGGDDE
jgi:hypothetical protein